MSNARRGRDQIAPMSRVLRLLLLLSGSVSAVATEQLLSVGAYGAKDGHNAKRMLNRDIDELNRSGWDIRNVAAAGEDGRYQLFARDNRLGVVLTPQQRLALLRAAATLGEPAISAGLGLPHSGVPTPRRAASRPQQPDPLDRLLRAVARRCRTRFTYKDRPRALHPYSVYSGPSGWYIRGHEDGDPDTVKEFVVDRMVGVALDASGTADPEPKGCRHPQLDPLSWLVDPPVDVVLETSHDYRPRVELLLGAATDAEERAGKVRLTYTVTHRAAFRWRVYELGERLRVLHPPVIRNEIVAELGAIAGRPA